MRSHPVRRLCVPLAAVLVALVLTGSAPPSAGRPRAAVAGSLSADLDRLFEDSRLTGAQVSAVVADAATGEVLYRHTPGALMLPASTLKTVTAAAALDLLGADHRFGTDILAAGRRDGTTLDGDLVLRGGGDPSLLPADLDTLARQVADSGVSTVSGGLLADASRYDGVPLGPNWAWDDQAAYYSPQISALTLATDTDYDPGTVRLTLTPGRAPGEPATVRVTPSDAPVRLAGRIATGEAGSDRTVDVGRQPATNELVLTGSVPADGGTSEEWVAVDDPARLAATVFAADLARHGVTVHGPVGAGRAPADATALAHHDSAPLSALMVPFLKLSNNGIAEHLVKEIGRVRGGAGSWSAGLDRIADFVHRNGLDVTAARQADGSGLSRHNLMTAQRLLGLLEFARSQPWFATWYDALPVAGDPRRMVGGSLSNRLTGTPAEGRVHAKTGSMTGVDALAGYLDRPDGHTLAFTVLLNNFAGNSPRPVIDAFVLRLFGDTATTAAAAAPADGRRTRSPHDWENACSASSRC
ncbi:D-alanyl-D-alanine carboxypeptidase/D-alanyl-D-alanine endopeptidase [Saccharothrix sp. ST-888]|uniref:D-alanyl-D-alanine carboxypeptidase/D-alanyl-D-alanine endopeptidase n=1 Tax=Saccharothrix sp. ST-888 TaxID=1427391 RepID=UPI000696F20C|nr:D-alanyl-D-alanine carboxypeptidase/D-alanyl-D-alanine-endopeptidase [Saccharothrix sp. ST-888]